MNHQVSSADQRNSHREREIAIFWDYENVPLPSHTSPAEAAKKIQQAVSEYGRRIEMRRVYFDPNKARRSPRDASGLDSSGFDLVHTPSRNNKETLDKKLIVDVLAFAWDCSGRDREPCVVMITSDGDYAYTLSKLRDRGVMNVVMYGKEGSTAGVLIDNAEVALSFEKEVLALPGKKSSTFPKDDKTQQGPTHSTATTTTSIFTNSGFSHRPLSRSGSGPRFPRTVPSDQELTWSDSARHEAKLSSKAAASNSTCIFKDDQMDIDHDVVAFCICLSSKQRKFEKGLRVKYEDAWIPGKILQETFRAPSDLRSPNACKLARDNAIFDGLVESARKEESKRRTNNYVIVELGTGLNSNLSREYYLRLTQKGRQSLKELQLKRVQDLCSFLYKKQKDWEYGNKVNFEKCWIPSPILQREYTPIYPPADRNEFNMLCKETRDNAISVGFVEKSRRRQQSCRASNSDNGLDFIPVPLGEKIPLDGLSKEFYVRLTAVGRQVVEKLDQSSQKATLNTTSSSR